MTWRLGIGIALLLTGCPAGGAGSPDASGLDAGADGASGSPDAGVDAGLDAGSDAGVDAGPMDAGPSMCGAPSACAPGAMEETDECGRCGVQTRTCNTSCVWTPFECVEDAERCTYWVHADGATRWTGYRLRGGAFGPSDAVRAAVPLDGTEDALVIAGSTYHRLRRTCEPGVSECWVESGPITALFPEVGVDPILYATDIPEAFRGDGFEGIDLSSATTDYRYLYEVATGAITHQATNPITTPGPGAPERSSTRASFTVLGNAAGWLAASCGDPPTVPADFIVSVEDTDVFVFAPGEGCLFLHRALFATWGPFGEADAPTAAQVGAAFHRAGLFVLR